MSFRRHIITLVALSFLSTVAAAQQNAAGQQQGGDLGPYRSIIERGVFGDGTVTGPGAVATSPQSPYRLIGTLEGGERAGAVLDTGTGEQAFYRVGQKLPDDSRIISVQRGRVRIKRPDGTVFDLVAEEAPPGPSAQQGAPSRTPAPAGAVSPPASRPHRARPSGTDD